VAEVAPATLITSLPHTARYLSKFFLGPTWNVHTIMSDLPNTLVSSSVFLTPTLNAVVLHSLRVKFCAPSNNVSSRHSETLFLERRCGSKDSITVSTSSTLMLLHHVFSA